MTVGDTKRIAMIVRDRQGEALRVAGGLTLVDDIVEVFVLDGQLDAGDPEVARPLELVNELGLKLYSNVVQDGVETIASRTWRRSSWNTTLLFPTDTRRHR
jgi:hypothetical protein